MIKQLFNIQPVHAHCDVPCGIYDPSSAQVAALSVARFLDLIAELEEKISEDGTSASTLARLSRLVEQKESHAAAVKSEIVIIWGDYIKAPQLEKFPEIHDLVHKIMLKASACKQDTHPEDARDLMDLVNRFAEIFWQTKGIETETVVSSNLPNLNFVRPVLPAAK